jgi:holo-[acyl-carrier protein] synthase
MALPPAPRRWPHAWIHRRRLKTTDLGHPMIIGIGADICDIRRIERSLARFGARFETRVFTPQEIARSSRRRGVRHNSQAASYAKRFAAKEAFGKALGTGIAHGVFWRDIEVINLPSGKPTLHITGKAAALLERQIPAGHQINIHLTLTDEYPLAQAQVILELVPKFHGNGGAE